MLKVDTFVEIHENTSLHRVMLVLKVNDEVSKMNKKKFELISKITPNT